MYARALACMPRFLPIPEGGMSDSEFESGVTTFMQDANGYITQVKAQSPRR